MVIVRWVPIWQIRNLYNNRKDNMWRIRRWICDYIGDDEGVKYVGDIGDLQK